MTDGENTLDLTPDGSNTDPNGERKAPPETRTWKLAPVSDQERTEAAEKVRAEKQARAEREAAEKDTRMQTEERASSPGDDYTDTHDWEVDDQGEVTHAQETQEAFVSDTPDLDFSDTKVWEGNLNQGVTPAPEPATAPRAQPPVQETVPAPQENPPGAPSFVAQSVGEELATMSGRRQTPPGQPKQARSEQTSDIPVLESQSEPDTIGSGKVTGVLGKGGCATVYEVRNDQLDVSRAVKLLHATASPGMKERFFDEVRIMAKLNHRNIVQVHNVGEWRGMPFFEMQKIDGPSLAQQIEKRGAFPEDVCVAIGVMLLRALAYTRKYEYWHEGTRYQGLIHGDLKPKNIMIARDGNAMLMDFGIASLYSISEQGGEKHFVGSLQYVAPEHMSGEGVDCRSDLYSFGCVMYEMLTGRPVFPTSGGLQRLMERRRANQFKPLDSYELNAGRSLKQLVEECLAFDPAERAANTEVLLRRLAKIHSSLSNKSPEETVRRWLNTYTRSMPTAAPPSHSGPMTKRHWAIIGVGTVMLLAVIAFLALMSRGRRQHADVQQVAKSDDVTVFDPEEVFSDEADIGSAKKEDTQPSRRSSGRTTKGRSGLGKRTTATRRSPKKFGVDDEDWGKGPSLLPSMERALREGRNHDVILIHDRMRPDESKRPAAYVMHLRALQKVGTPDDVEGYLRMYSPADKEFLLAKARLLFGKGEYTDAVSVLERIPEVDIWQGNAVSHDREAAYLIALCNTSIAKAEGSKESAKRALDSWFSVKTAFRNKTSHAYYAAAQQNIRQLSRQVSK